MGRQRRRFVPSFGMDHLEVRSMLDGADGSADDAIGAAELASVGGDPNFALADQVGETAIADPGLHVAANQADTKQALLDFIEGVRTSYNQWNDNQVKEEQAFQVQMQQGWARRFAETAGWPQGWWQNAWRPIEVEMKNDLIWYTNEYNESKFWEQQFVAEKVGANKALDALEAGIKLGIVDMGMTDGDGNEVFWTFYQNDSLDLEPGQIA